MIYQKTESGGFKEKKFICEEEYKRLHPQKKAQWIKVPEETLITAMEVIEKLRIEKQRKQVKYIMDIASFDYPNNPYFENHLDRIANQMENDDLPF